MKPLNVGLLGIGTVGRGTFDVLARNQQEIARRAGRGIRSRGDRRCGPRKGAQDRRRKSSGVVKRCATMSSQPRHRHRRRADRRLRAGDTLALEAIDDGKHVVTANKALLAQHGNEIFAAARSKGVMVAFEAAVAGGIPIIKALREGLTANRIEWIAGIINGTSNFILSEMRARGIAFDAALAEAQRLGYAEADPTFDIEGIDAAHKLTIMAAIAFGMPMQFDAAYTEGISKLTREDIRTPRSSAIASSCSASPSARPTASSCACIRRWCRRSA